MFLLSLLWCHRTGQAAELLFPGIHSKVSAGAGQTVSRGSSALFYNPANLIFSKWIEPYLDVSFAQIKYTYQHTNTEKYAPAVVAVTAPPVTAGLSMRLIPSFAIGGAILPTGTGDTRLIESVPIDIAGAYTESDIAQTETAYKVAAGAAYRLSFPITLGVGIIYHAEKEQLIVTPTNRESALVDALYGGNWIQFTAGFRSELMDRNLVLAGSFKSAVTKTYSGDKLILVTENDPNAQYEDYQGKGYIPMTLGFGAEYRFGMIGAYFDYTREAWSAGRTIATRGFPGDPPAKDYVDTNNFAVGVKVWPWPKHMFTAGFGMYGANVGVGTENSTGGDVFDLAEEGEVDGVGFGDLDAVPRTIFSGGYRYKLSGHGYVETGVHYAKGSRVVPENFAGEGLYTLSVMMGSVGIGYSF